MTCETYQSTLNLVSWFCICLNLFSMYCNYRNGKTLIAGRNEQELMLKKIRAHLDYCQDLRKKYGEEYDK